MSKGCVSVSLRLDVGLAKVSLTSHGNGGYPNENARKEEKGERDDSRQHNQTKNYAKFNRE